MPADLLFTFPHYLCHARVASKLQLKKKKKGEKVKKKNEEINLCGKTAKLVVLPFL